MSIRGENIGTAYVRILADGSRLGQSLRDSFEDQDEVFDQQGKRGSQRYKDAFAEDMKSRTGKNTLEKSLSDALARNDALDQFLNAKDNRWVNFRKRLKREFGEAGSLAGKQLEQDLIAGMSFEQLEGRLGNLTREIAGATRKIQTEEIRTQAEAIQMNKEFDRERLQEQNNMLAEAHRMNTTFNQQKLTAERNMLNEAYNMNRSFDRAELKAQRDMIRARMEMLTEASRMNAEFDRKGRAHITRIKADYRDLMELVERMNKGDEESKQDRGQLIKHLQNLRLEMGRLGLSTHTTTDRLRDNEERLFRMNPTMRRWTKSADDMGNAIGRAFGKGSRNDFLNFQGAVAGGLSRMVLTFIPRTIGAIQSYVGKLRYAAAQGKSVLGVLGKDIGKIVGGLGGALGGLFLIIGPLVSIFSQLLGAALALISSISFGLVGAIGALGGTLLPLGAAIGVAILGFKNLDGEAKKAAKGVANAFKGLGDDASRGLTFDRTQFEDDHHHVVLTFEQTMGRLREMVNDLRPVMFNAGRGFADAMNIFAVNIGKKGGPWDQFIQAMKGSGEEVGWLGDHVRLVGRIFGEVFGGMLGVFRGVMPITHEFLVWARDLSVEFRKWANSPEGIREMHSFFDRAADSAKELGGFLAAIGGLIGTIIDAGQQDGDSIFASMTKGLEKWDRALEADGGKGLREWFADSRRFIERVGDAFVEILGLFKDLDTAASRDIATAAFRTLADVLEVLAAVLGPIVRLMDGVNEATNGAAGKVAAAALIFPRLTGAIGGTTGKMGGFITNMRGAETRMTALKNASRGLAGAGGLALITDASRRGGNAVGGLENILGGAALGFAVGGPIGAAVGGLGGAFLTMVQHSKAAGDSAREAYKKIAKVDTIKVARASLEDLKDTLNQVTGAYTGTTRAAVLQKLADADLIEVGQKFGVSQRTMVNAALGQKNAMNELYPVIGKVEDKIRDLTDRQAELADKRAELMDVDLSGDESGALTRSINNQVEAIDEETLSIEKNKKGLQTNLDVLRQMPGQLRKQGREVRNTAAATADYSGLLHGIPQDIRSKIQADGIIPSIKGVAKVAEKYDLVDRKHIRTLIEATGDTATKAKINAVLRELGILDAKKPKPKIDADTGPVDAAVEHATRRLFDLGGKTVNPKIEVQSNVDSIVGDVNWALDHIADEVVNVITQNKNNRTASGGTFNFAQTRLIGEAGPEAVVPLNRPLGMVDPSVRWLSAIAQGKEPMARGGVIGGGGKNVHVEQHIYSPNADPRAVATEAINHMVATGY